MKISHLYFDQRSNSVSLIAKTCLALACMITTVSAAEPGAVTELMKQNLVGFPGKEVAMITVDYSPGAQDPIHRHNASAFVYVL
jgi:quercetin dioxygenase-like cupin family protein